MSDAAASLGKQRWAYMRTQIDVNKIKDSDGALEEFGRQGWELIDVVYTQTYVHFWFKRPLDRG